jgi:hypothetical protein
MDGKRLPIIDRSVGFFYPRVHASLDNETTRRRRQTVLPNRMPQGTPITHDFLYQPLRTGDKLRQTLFLGNLDDLEGVEVAFNFGATTDSDFGPETGRSLEVRAGRFAKSLHKLGAWPPVGPDATGNVTCAAMLPPKAFQANAVNTIELHHRGDTVLHIPCVPACMEPYIPPLSTAEL